MNTYTMIDVFSSKPGYIRNSKELRHPIAPDVNNSAHCYPPYKHLCLPENNRQFVRFEATSGLLVLLKLCVVLLASL